MPLESAPSPVENWESYPSIMGNLTLNLTMEYVNTSKGAVVPTFRVEAMASDIKLHVISEKSRTSIFAGYSIITLYVSVVLVVGRLLRGMFSGTYYKIVYDDMPNPTPLLKLCSGVEVARYEGNLIEESRLYWSLIEVLRSNELIKLITKTSHEFYIYLSREDAIANNQYVPPE